MDRIKIIILLIAQIMITPTIAEESKYFMQYNFSLYKHGNYKDGHYGTSIVNLGAGTCNAFFYTGVKTDTPIYRKQINYIEWANNIVSSQYDSIYYGKCSDGTYFVEKAFYKRPVGEGICFYNIPEEYYENIKNRLNKVRYLPLELFRDSLCLMRYKLTGAFWDSYEEGCIGAAQIRVDSATSFYAHYFNGAMMGTPLYRSQIKNIEYVNRVDTFNIDNKFFSQTGRLDIGKTTNGTYFVEKLFYKNCNGLPQGIILFEIPKEYLEDVIQQLISLSNLPAELFGDCFCLKQSRR